MWTPSGRAHGIVWASLKVWGGGGCTDLAGINLSGFRLTAADFANVNISGADLTRADLTEARFNNAVLDGSRFEFAQLRLEYFSGVSSLDGASFVMGDLSEVHFSGVRAEGLNFERAVLTKADLRSVSLPGVSFRHSSLVETRRKLTSATRCYKEQTFVRRICIRPNSTAPMYQERASRAPT